MGKYRATLNMPQARCGQVVELDDQDPEVQRLVFHHHLIPVDAVAKDAVNEEIVIATAPPMRSPDAIRAALAAARAASQDSGASSVSTAFEVEGTSDTAEVEEAPEVEETSEDAEPKKASKARQSRKY